MGMCSYKLQCINYMVSREVHTWPCTNTIRFFHYWRLRLPDRFGVCNSTTCSHTRLHKTHTKVTASHLVPHSGWDLFPGTPKSSPTRGLGFVEKLCDEKWIFLLRLSYDDTNLIWTRELETPNTYTKSWCTFMYAYVHVRVQHRVNLIHVWHVYIVVYVR
jgi:hypothetical protein